MTIAWHLMCEPLPNDHCCSTSISCIDRYTYSKCNKTSVATMKIVERPDALMGHIDALVSIADNYKTEIGFWPRSRLQQAILRGRLIAAVDHNNNREIPIGFLIFGGVFPNGRIQAVAVAQNHTRCGVAQTLINSIVAKLEAEGYLAISAKPAKDLHSAQALYQKNKFEVVRTQPGGKARNREIVVRERLLVSPSLLSPLETATRSIIRPSSDNASNLWVIDINVLFDLVKMRRTQYLMATGIFSAALDGRARVVVTSEFSSELSRKAASEKHDPLFEVAKALPRLRISAGTQLQSLADEIHKVVFEVEKPSQADTPQARSDCRHIAECVLGNASAFVTSDGVLLRNRRLIREKWGLEVVALEDFHEALSSTILQEDFEPARGDGFHLVKIDASTARKLAKKLTDVSFDESCFEENATRTAGYFTAAINDDDDTVALLASVAPDILGHPHRMLLLVDHDQPRAELVADTLLNQAIDNVGRSGFSLIRLADTPGQIIARKVALRAGFTLDDRRYELLKAALGSPITPSRFQKSADQMRLVYGDRCSGLLPESFNRFDELLRTNPDEFVRVEKALAPTLIVSNCRRVSIQPIAQTYAAQLLGTSAQTNWLEQFEGVFRSQKIYVSSGRSKNRFVANQIILFYESSRTGGRGSVVAAARVDNVVTQEKSKISEKEMKKTVLDGVERYSTSQEVTLTGFSSLLRFPRPVPLNELKRIQATGTQNLQTTTVIATEAAQRIFDLGWVDGY